LAWDTLFPSIGFLPVTWQTRDMASSAIQERRGFYRLFAAGSSLGYAPMQPPMNADQHR